MNEIKQALRRLGDDELRNALAQANLPTLLVSLSHLTGDPTWVRPPFAAGGPRGMDDNDSGDLPEEVQQAVREAAVGILREWADGRRPDPEPLSAERLVELMSAQAGEPVGPEFVDMISEELGLTPRVRVDAAEAVASASAVAPDEPDVLIVGAGIGGVTAGVMLGAAGFDYRIVEKNPGPGGTWWENGYPGAGVDTPSHLYSFSFAQRPDWSRFYAKAPEINAYIAETARRFGVDKRTSFETRAETAEYDEAAQRWAVRVERADGTIETLRSRFLISAVGQLNVPRIPDFPGMDAFRGPIVHSARWPAELDLAGKRVACVGSGASAMQLVPLVAQEAGELLVFQRSPQWVAPNAKYFREVTDEIRTLFEAVPFYLGWYRFRLFWMFNDKVHRSLQIDPEWPDHSRSINAANEKHRQFFTNYIVEQLGDRQDLLPKVLPDYPPFGKRMLFDNGWYRALRRPNVQLITEGVRGFTENGIVTASGEEFPVDVVVLATGFEALRVLGSIDVRGRGGRSVRDVWGDDDAYAYLGIAVPGFPNFFCVYGPNTNLGHGGSLILNIECQTRYIVDLLTKMRERERAVAEVKRQVCRRYVDDVDAAHGRMIWSLPTISTWYRNSAGRVVTNSPWRLVDYWRMTRSADLADYHLEGPGDEHLRSA